MASKRKNVGVKVAGAVELAKPVKDTVPDEGVVEDVMEGQLDESKQEANEIPLTLFFRPGQVDAMRAAAKRANMPLRELIYRAVSRSLSRDGTLK